MFNYECDRMFGTCERGVKEAIKQGGLDNKYRKLQGIGEYSKPANAQQRGRRKSKACINAGDADNRQEQSSKGEYP